LYSTLRKCIKRSFYLFVFSIVTSVFAGSYEDFFSAIKRDDERTLTALLARGFDVNTSNPEGLHPLYLALREPSVKVSEVLLDVPKIDVNALNPKGESALMIAALTGQDAAAEKLVRLGADLNKTGWTPLHYAATGGNIKLMMLFLEHHAFVDAESPNGTTPLMMAAMYGTADAVKLLLTEGAVPHLKNQQGLTAIDFARRADRPDVAELIATEMRKQSRTGKW
jgi:uncharacterized protein